MNCLLHTPVIVRCLFVIVHPGQVKPPDTSEAGTGDQTNMEWSLKTPQYLKSKYTWSKPDEYLKCKLNTLAIAAASSGDDLCNEESPLVHWGDWKDMTMLVTALAKIRH